MKLIAIALMLMIGTAQANGNEICLSLSDLSESVMQLRQDGAHPDDLYNRLSREVTNPDLRDIIHTIVYGAFAINRVYGKYAIDQISEEYANKVYGICIRSIGTYG